jgi:gluconate 2-dehydrogenase gamma chain
VCAIRAPGRSLADYGEAGVSHPDNMKGVYSRRSMIEAALALGGIIGLGGLATVRAIAAEARTGTTLRFFIASEAEAVEALVAQIIPTDDTPGAREMGVARFLDHALAGLLSPLAAAFRVGLADLETSCRAVHPGSAGFASL